jgi:hypothetical protein
MDLPQRRRAAGRRILFPAPMQRHPMPVFWIVVQVLIIICVLISAVIVIVKL